MIDESSLLNLDILEKSKNANKEGNIKKSIVDISGESNSEEIDIQKRDIRDTFYGKIDVSVKTMDIVITVLMIALFASIVLGIVL